MSTSGNPPSSSSDVISETDAEDASWTLQEDEKLIEAYAIFRVFPSKRFWIDISERVNRSAARCEKRWNELNPPKQSAKCNQSSNARISIGLRHHEQQDDKSAMTDEQSNVATTQRITESSNNCGGRMNSKEASSRITRQHSNITTKRRLSMRIDESITKRLKRLRSRI